MDQVDAQPAVRRGPGATRETVADPCDEHSVVFGAAKPLRDPPQGAAALGGESGGTSMIRWAALLTTMLLSSSCQTTTKALPFCAAPAADSAWSPPVCEDPSGLIEFRNEIEGLVVPAAGQFAVRVFLDEDARIAGACTIRGPGAGAWTTRTRLAEALDSSSTLPQAPVCAANSEMLFNRAASTIEVIKLLVRDCERQEGSLRGVSQCLDDHQRRRDELWVFGSFGQRYRVFLPGPDPSPRRAALLACTEQSAAEGLGGTRPVGIARVGADLEQCLRSKGWKELR